jgi:anti-sigma B factor antagonist
MACRHVPVTGPTGRRAGERRPREVLTGLTVSREFCGDITCLTVAGEVDLSTAPLLAAALRPHPMETADTLVVDLQEVSFISARGIDILVAAAHRASRQGTHLRVLPSHPVLRVATLLGLRHELSSEPDADVMEMPRASIPAVPAEGGFDSTPADPTPTRVAGCQRPTPRAGT